MQHNFFWIFKSEDWPERAGHIYLKGAIPNTELTQPATLVIKATQV